MGTRGLYGFYRDGVTKATYNHYDSYPEGLGAVIVDFLRSTSIHELNRIFDNIILIDEHSKPTEEQIENCAPFTNLGVSNQSTDDWYCLLRNAQGGLDAYKEGLKYMIDSQGFIQDSLFCEYAYIINLDDNVLEIYEGFQKEPVYNRYSNGGRDGEYYACKQVEEFELDYLPVNWLDILNQKLGA
jgi:hypothetical protein